MYNLMKINGDQKTGIIITSLFMAFLYILITLPSANVGVYMHNIQHTWAVVDSNGVALEDERGVVIKNKKGYHCILMERAFGEDDHIVSFPNDAWEKTKAEYLELKQFEIDNPIKNTSTPNFGLFLLIMGGLILGVSSVFGLQEFFPNTFNKITAKLKR